MSKNACHLLIGHGDDFKAYVPRAELLALTVRRGKITLVAAQTLALKTRVYK
jgi:hypothetical protein